MKNLILLCLLSFLVSCSSTLDFHVPTQSFMTPEVVGETLGFRGQATFSNSTKFRLASLEQRAIFSSQIDVSTEEGTSKDNVLNGTAGLGLGNAVELTYRAYADSPDLVGGKVQVWGRDGGKREEGLKASLFGGYGEARTDDDSLTASNLNNGSRTYKSTLDVKSYELGATVGYRINKFFLTYLSGNYRSSKAEGTLTSSSNPTVNLSNDAIVRSLQSGLQVNKEKAYILLEGGYAKSIWKGLDPRDDYTLGISIGLTSI